jgi:hypothetical protein
MFVAMACGGCDDEVEETPTPTIPENDGGTDGDAGDIAAPTYTNDIKPILSAKCGSCHGSPAPAGSELAANYSATQASATSCADENVATCMLTRIVSGEMPQGAGCTGTPATDADNAACLTAAELASLQAWVAAGSPE